MTKKGTKESCICNQCKSDCRFKPGWFLPDEAEKVANHLGITIEELFNTKLMVDWWEDYPEDIFLLSPAIINEDAGQEFTANPRGQCIFYKKGLCEIHPVKPFECKEALHNISAPTNTHQNVSNEWKTNQHQIENLLGRSPIAKECHGWE